MITLKMIKTLKKKTIEQLKDEYNFDEIKDAFDKGAVPHQLSFFMEVTMKVSYRPAIFCFLVKITMSLYCFNVQIRAKL